ncbi:MAG: HEPN domain-containing protein [Oscillospiraceae bacterium]|nr:HEPN domain-containing protein [Oscillospiraceae bacterium]
MDNEHNLHWFEFAERDLKTAVYLLTMRPIPVETVCFLCQQSAEKFLKGYLIYNGILEPPKIHDLHTLRKMCLKFDNSFEMIVNQCELLTHFGVLPRYPDELEIDDETMKRAVRYAEEVKDFEPLVEVFGELKGILGVEG